MKKNKMFRKLLNPNFVKITFGFITTSFLRSEKESKRTFFVYNNNDEVKEKTTFNLFGYDHFISFPWTKIVAVPKTMMDGTAELYGEITSYRIQDIFDLRYKVINPSKYYDNEVEYLNDSSVTLKKNLLSEIINLKLLQKSTNDDLTSLINKFIKTDKILESRRLRLKSLKENMGIRISSDFYEKELNKQLMIENDILNSTFYSDLERSYILIPKKDSIKSWFDENLKSENINTEGIKLTKEIIHECTNKYDSKDITVKFEEIINEDLEKEFLITVKYLDEIISTRIIPINIAENIEFLRAILKNQKYPDNVCWYYFMPYVNLDDFRDLESDYTCDLIIDDKTEFEYQQNNKSFLSVYYIWFTKDK